MIPACPRPLCPRASSSGVPSGGAAARSARPPRPTWQFTVGARSAPVDTSWGTTLDVNGDGYADVLVAAPDVMRPAHVFIYLGGARPASASSPQITLTGPASPALLRRVRRQRRRRQRRRLRRRHRRRPKRRARAYLYLGGAVRSRRRRRAVTSCPAAAAAANSAVRVPSAGDVNGDGYADVLVGDTDATLSVSGRRTGPSIIGSATASRPSPAIVLTLTPAGDASQFGHSVDGAGDVNGDGYADVVVERANVNATTDRSICTSEAPTGLAYLARGHADRVRQPGRQLWRLPHRRRR